MSSAPPPSSVTAPGPSSPPTPPAASPPAAPPPSNSTAGTPPPSASPPPASASSPPPVPASTPPPTSPALSPPPASTPPPALPSSPPPSPPAPRPSLPTPPASALPPASPSLPIPSSPSSPGPPASAPPPDSPSISPPPATPSVPSTPGTTPSTPRTPSTPGTPSTPSPPSRGSPPSPSGRTPATPPPPRSPTSPSSPSSSSSISTPLVVGIAVGAVALLVFLSILFFCCKKKKRRGPLQQEYYGGHSSMPPPVKDDIYGGQAQNWQHNVPPPADHVVKIPPYPSPPPVYASRPPNLPPSPPPPPAISSSGGSASNYSGSENMLLPLSPGVALGLSWSTFTYEELLMATDGFSDANLLGQGGFGYVHRGVLRNGKEVAVKQLKSGSGQGEREFQAEVEIISRVHHKHLVSLVGYCITGDKRLLVYEFVPNNTLEFHLHGKGRPTMDWSTRLKIALGSAKGLAYLHEDCHPKIIHRDIKAANILLDFNFEAKVADFGLAKFASDTNTHVSTRVMGTFGYLAPEYASTGKLTDKSDVFSFGVMLLELITGRRPVDSTNTLMDGSLVDWARPLLSQVLEDGDYDALVDPRLQNNYNTREMARMVACAAACVRHSARRRPRMSQVVRALEGDISLEDLNEGVRPGQSSVYGSYGSSDYDSSQYNEDMRRFKKLALTSEEYGSSDYGPGQNNDKRKSRLSVRTSQEYPSSEYSAATSEYGQNPSGSSSEAHQSHEMVESGGRMKDLGGFTGTTS